MRSQFFTMLGFWIVPMVFVLDVFAQQVPGESTGQPPTQSGDIAVSVDQFEQLRQEVAELRAWRKEKEVEDFADIEAGGGHSNVFSRYMVFSISRFLVTLFQMTQWLITSC